MKQDIAVYIQQVRASERVELKAPLRSQIEKDIAKFLAKGNEITTVENTLRSQTAKASW